MWRDGLLSLSHRGFGLSSRWVALAALIIALPAVFPLRAIDKSGMPDLCQVEQTCLPTSTANLLIWFGKNGYPKLILGQAGESEDDRALHTVHRLMADTDARFDFGTRPDKVAGGIKKYIQDAGYDCDVEYRGLGGDASFTPDWLKENDDPNKGFILLLAYCHYDENTGVFTNAWNAGHAVTLVTAQSDLLLVDDPAHLDDETGRKILTPQILTGGIWQEANLRVPVSGLMLLTGSLLDAPPDSKVMLIGAVCVTMHPLNDHPGSTSPVPVNAPASTIAGTGTSTPASAPAAKNTSWIMWLFDLLFKK